MRRNNILQVFSKSSWAGGEVYVFELSKRLIEDDYNLIAITKKSKEIEPRLRESGIRYYRLPISGVFDILSGIRLSSIINDNEIDIIHIHNFKTFFPVLYSLCFLKHRPKIVLTRHLVKKAKTNPLYNWAYKKIDRLIFVSNLAREEFFLTNPKLDYNKTAVVHNSINPPIAKPLEIRKSKEENEIIISFAGRLSPEKGVHLLIDAIGELSQYPIRLLIAGKGEDGYHKELEDRVRSNSLESKVEFLGFIESVQDLIAITDIGVVPSIWREPFGLSIIEFMKEGVPVITTNNGAQEEFVIDGQTGILIEPNSSKAIGDSIKRLIDNPSLRREIGRNAQKDFKANLSYESFYKKIIANY